MSDRCAARALESSAPLARSVRLGSVPQFQAHLLGGGHRTQQILAGEFRDVRIAPTSAHQFLEKRWVAIDTFESNGRIGDAVEV